MAVNTERDIDFLLRKYYQTTPSGKPLTHMPKYDRSERWSNESIVKFIQGSRRIEKLEIMKWMCREYRVNKEMQVEACYILDHINIDKFGNKGVNEVATMLLLYLRIRDNPKYIHKKNYLDMLTKEGLTITSFAEFLVALVSQLQNL